MNRIPARIRRAALLAPLVALMAATAFGIQPPVYNLLPEWTQIEYDCITGDHYANNTQCEPGLPANDDPNIPNLPQNGCNQPDILPPDANGVRQRCDEWNSDFYERPYAPGSTAIFRDQDLIYVL